MPSHAPWEGLSEFLGRYLVSVLSQAQNKVGCKELSLDIEKQRTLNGTRHVPQLCPHVLATEGWRDGACRHFPCILDRQPAASLGRHCLYNDTCAPR
jgi:hypothetical protein